MPDEGVLPAPPQHVRSALRREIGPIGRSLSRRYFEHVRLSHGGLSELGRLSQSGFVVHVMRTTAWVNFLFLAWALVRHGLPPLRAVVNLRRWFTKPWIRCAQRGAFQARFTYARRNGGSALVFLRESALNTARGRESREDPFPALVEMARASEAPLFLVPELFAWEKWQQKITPSVFDRIFGSPEAPGFLHSVGAFFRNYKRAQFRVGQPIDLKKFVSENPADSTQVLARKVRSALNHHLARETRAVFGPPRKTTDRLIEEAMRDRTFQKSVAEVAGQRGRSTQSVEREARRNFNTIAARYSPTLIGVAAPLLHWVFTKIYDGVDVDEAGLERAMKAAGETPLVLTPSHKSHVDYLIMSYVLFARGYQIPLVAAGANLSFFPLGPFLRRGGAFFLRRSFKGDALYTATFKAYLKKLVHDGIHHEFFPEGGRSRTGKLLQPKLGLFTWLVEAVLEGARNDLLFVPVAIDYEKVVEGSSYSSELKGGDKKPEDLKALLAAPKVLTERYGRIHLTFDEPVSLAQLMRERHLAIHSEVSDEAKKGLVRALGHRVMYGISRVSTVTPHALLAAALLAHRRRGVSARELLDRIQLLRRLCEELAIPLSRQLINAPSSPVVLGPIRDAMHIFASEGCVRIVETRGEPIYQLEDDRRGELSFYKNTLLNQIAGPVIVASAMMACEHDSTAFRVREFSLFLSRLFKFEFLYPVGKTFEVVFDEAVARLVGLGMVSRTEDQLLPSSGPFARPLVQFLGDLLRDFLESYLLMAQEVAKMSATGVEKKELVRRALESGQADFLAGTIAAAEALSKPNLENALQFLVDQQYLKEKDKKMLPGTRPIIPLVSHIRAFVPEVR